MCRPIGPVTPDAQETLQRRERPPQLRTSTKPPELLSFSCTAPTICLYFPLSSLISSRATCGFPHWLLRLLEHSLLWSSIPRVLKPPGLDSLGYHGGPLAHSCPSRRLLCLASQPCFFLFLLAHERRQIYSLRYCYCPTASRRRCGSFATISLSCIEATT